MATPEPSLRDRQIASVEKLLNLNHALAEDTTISHDVETNGAHAKSVPILDADGEPIWKVLVFDNLGRDIISSILHVKDLRTWGVTIHLNINASRHAIPDVPVLYLVEPTAANIEIICNDLKNGLYSPAYVNFLHSITRPLLEDFATQVASADLSDNISQVYDQYLNFIVSEPNLFSLGMGKDVYAAMNSAAISDEDLDAKIDQIVVGLFSVTVTMGSIPIIRCPKGGAAEMVAAKLDRKLRDHILNAKDNLFSGTTSWNSTSFSRPILILVDRNVDLVPMLSHSWTYQSLVHDVLQIKLNRITLEESDPDKPDAPAVKRSYDLTSTDFFWAKNASEPFPTAAENLDTEIKRYKDDASEITNKTGTTSIDEIENDAATAARHQHFKAAISKLPELRERKNTLDMHTKIATTLFKGVAARQLDTYYQLEETISKQTKKQMLDVINDPNKGDEPVDKLRLFIIWYLSTEQAVSRAEMEQFTDALKAAGADVTPVAYVRRIREITRATMIASAPSQSSQSSTSKDLFRGFSSLSKGVTDKFKEAGITGIGTNFDNIISSVKNFLPVNQDSTLTKITESLMDPANASTSALQKTESYLYFDPRNAHARGTMPAAQSRGNDSSGVARGIEASFGQRRQGFSDAIVFTVGGGSMDEYGNLQEWANKSAGQGAASVVNRKRIVYGSTELVNARDFLAELTSLGKEVV